MSTYDEEDDVSGVFDAPLKLAELDSSSPSHVIAGRYEILDHLGAGGMGQVVKVQHLRLGKAFAVKLMQADFMAHADARSIFHREARLASALSHPNIISVVDFGEDPDWGLFIVMEYLNGVSLARRLANEGALPVAAACDVAWQLADALRHSHAHDVVHGDLKADNVFCLAPQPDDRRKWNVKLLDFGTAHLAKAAQGTDTQISGTPEYMAPERITGTQPQPSMDIYALGVLLYEMLAGTVPFTADNPVEILQMHLGAEAPPIDARRGEPVEPGLVEIVRTAMHKQPAQRFPDMHTMARELERFMKGRGLRRRGRARATTLAPGTSRTDAAAAAFDALGVPAAGLDAHGNIVVANAAMAKLLGFPNLLSLEGYPIMETKLAQLRADLRDDVRHVAMDSKVVRRRLAVTSGTGAPVVMRMVMSPAREPCGPCLLVIYPTGQRVKSTS